MDFTPVVSELHKVNVRLDRVIPILDKISDGIFGIERWFEDAVSPIELALMVLAIWMLLILVLLLVLVYQACQRRRESKRHSVQMRERESESVC